MKNKTIFIDENINISKGENAEQLLKKKNDKIFLNEEKGVVKVTKECWYEAQACEKNHWFNRGKSVNNNRNDYHRDQFDGVSDEIYFIGKRK